MKKILQTLVMVSLLLSCNSKETKKEVALEKAPEIPQVTVTITDSTYTAPSQLPSGYVNIELINKASDMHAAHLIKLDDDYTSEQLINTYADSMRTGGERPKWMTHRGGLIAEPGTRDITMFLKPGNYTWVCVMGDEAAPHFAGFEHQAVTVSGEIDENMKLEKPDVVIAMTDENFEIDKKMESGEQAVEIKNIGSKYHLAAISKLNQGATAADFTQWFMSPNGPPPAQGIIATSAIGPGLAARLNLNLEAGDYILFCMANAEGKFHLFDGAIKTFTVE